MKKSIFATVQFSISVLFMAGFFASQHHFSGIEKIRWELAQTKTALEEEQLKNEIVLYELESFRQEVATHIPEALKGKDSYQIRNLASIASSSTKEMSLKRPEAVFEEAKREFMDGQGHQARQTLQSFIDTYPLHPSIVEAHFLITKSLFDSKNYEQSLRYVEIMLKRYPEHELTGYALMMTADVYLERERFEDAEYVYRMIKKNFSNHAKLHLEARKRLEKWGI